MRSGNLLRLALVALVSLAAGQAQAQCVAGAIGTARRVEIDTTGGPRFGHNQYPGPELLAPGEIVLTFDDGPHKQLTPVILDVLDQHCAKATFFMVGQRAMGYSDLVHEVARRGHTIGTHTWSHANLRQKGHDGAIAEIELGISAVQKSLGGPAAPFFRFPYLSDPASAIAHLRSRSTAIFSIDVDSFDFRTRSPTVVIRNVTQQLKAKGRGIILFHDIQPSTAGALGSLLADLKSSGFRVVHLVPRKGQTTIADFDRRVGSPSRTVAALGLPVARRTMVAPAWEQRVEPLQQVAPAAAPQIAAAAVQGVPTPEPRPAVVRPARERVSDDWRTTIFRGW
ncbi:MAG: polysaccharide deacetylase family protein [Hyphomicrobiaceae bacterium]